MLQQIVQTKKSNAKPIQRDEFHLPSIKSGNVEEYKNLKKRVISLHNHKQVSKQENDILLTLREIDALLINTRRLKKAKNSKIFTLPDEDNSVPLNDTYFKFMCNEMNTRKKQVMNSFVG